MSISVTLSYLALTSLTLLFLPTSPSYCHTSSKAQGTTWRRRWQDRECSNTKTGSKKVGHLDKPRPWQPWPYLSCDRLSKSNARLYWCWHFVKRQMQRHWGLSFAPLKWLLNEHALFSLLPTSEPLSVTVWNDILKFACYFSISNICLFCN